MYVHIQRYVYIYMQKYFDMIFKLENLDFFFIKMKSASSNRVLY